MLYLNFCKLVSEYGTVEVLDEFIFGRFLINNNTVVVKEISNLQNAIESFNRLNSIFLKDKFSLYFIRILSRRKVVAEFEEINLVYGVNLSNNFNFNFNGDNLFIEFESDELEITSEEFNIFKKKEELLNLLDGEVFLKKRWFNLTRFEKKCWLDLAFSKEIDNLQPVNLDLIIDGNYILCEDDLYCYLGEEVYGVLGYLAYNSNALADVISTLPLKIKWINFDFSRAHFDSKEDLEYLVDILKKHSSLVIMS